MDKVDKEKSLIGIIEIDYPGNQCFRLGYIIDDSVTEQHFKRWSYMDAYDLMTQLSSKVPFDLMFSNKTAKLRVHMPYENDSLLITFGVLFDPVTSKLPDQLLEHQLRRRPIIEIILDS